MRICIQLLDALSEGTQTPTRGEGRWSLSLASALGHRGHQVEILSGGSSPSWGSFPRESAITLLTHPDLTREYDVFFTVSYFPGVPIPAKAKLVLAGQFAPQAWHQETLPPHHWIISPYASGFYVTWPKLPQWAYLPLPYYTAFPHQKGFNRPHLSLPGLNLPRPEGRQMLEVLIQLQKTHSFAVDFIKGQPLPGMYFHDSRIPAQVEAMRAYQVLDLVGQLRDVSILPPLPWQTLVDRFSTLIKLHIPIVGVSGMLDSVCSGGVPLLREATDGACWPPYFAAYQEVGLPIPIQPDKAALEHHIVTVLQDRDLYEALVSRLEAKVADLQIGSAVKRFEDFVGTTLAQ